MDMNKIEKKWQKKWEENKTFQPEVDKNKPKYLLTFPYPYINAYTHIGHLYTLMRVEALSRYKKLKGFNVLFPQGWHATGSPIVNAADRVKAREEKQIKIMKDMGFSEQDFVKFEKPEYWIEFFAPEFEKDYKSLGLSIDWRRNFYTTSLNPHYDKFIAWQFNTLKKGGFVKQGKFPVVWCEKDNSAVGDHSRMEGEGETAQEFTLLKFKTQKDNEFIICATLRPETVYGQTNLWIGPKNEYVKADVNGEVWIISEPAVNKLVQQEKEVKIIEKINGSDLIGKKVNAPMINKKIPILPANFCNVNKGTGIVTSVPSDAPDDWMGLHDLQNNKQECEKYGLDYDMVKSIKPIAIIDSEGLGDMAAVKICEDMGIKSQNDRKKLEEAKKIVYKKGFYEGVMNKNCEGFSGLKVEDAKDKVKQKLIDNKEAELLYELTGKVVCRCLTPSIVKIVSDQWFLDYGDEKWKELTHKCLDKMKLFPEKSRQQFDYVVDWLHKWACTREEGLGSRLPWDEKWVIESLSDSTVYMAYYTINHLLVDEKPEDLNDELFDYIFRNEKFSDKIKLSKEKVDKLKEEFEYWYPVDFRNSGKDLIQNHLTFFIFNHVAIFDEKYWPKGIGVNGWVTVDGQKMSKSLGNMILVRDMIKQFSADASRITILNGGESLDDPNWDTSFAKNIMPKITNLFDTFIGLYDKGVSDLRSIDTWAESEINRIIKEATEFMEETHFRSAIQKIFFETQNLTKWYLTRTNNNPNKDVMNKIIDSMLVMMHPFTAHITEEYNEKLGKKDLVVDSLWPSYDKKKINEELGMDEKIIENTTKDIHSVKKLAKVENIKKITLITSKSWKYDYFNKLKSLVEKTRNVSEILKGLMNDSKLRPYGKDISKLTPRLVSTNKVPNKVLEIKKEKELFNQSKEYFEKTFDCETIIVSGDETDNPKANNAIPGKPAIIIE